VLILSGDHIYRMDYAAMLAFHEQRNAHLTLACMGVTLDEARQFGVMSVDAENRVVQFAEKPQHPQPDPEADTKALVSMGIYVFSLDLLQQVLEEDHQREDSAHDFGNDIIPRLIDQGRVYGYRFGGEAGRVSPDHYWRDVGTLDSYYEANMDLLNPVPSLNLYQSDWPIRTYQSQYPPARTVPGHYGSEGIFVNSITAGGVVIMGGSVQHSILFPRVRVDEEAIVHDSILFNNVEVGAGAQLERCIVDKDVKIPPGERIGVDREVDAARFTISEKGVVVVPKNFRFA
jgi:glucose-1-phosphate adenylyltransferase